MMRGLLLALALQAAPAAAQEDPDARLREAAEAYVALPANRQAMDAMMAPDMVLSPLRAGLPPNLAQDQERLAQATAIIVDEVQAMRPQMEAAMIEAAVGTFALAQIEAMLAFHSAPEGRARDARWPARCPVS
ncbi:MAG: hypothetical protein AAGC92_05055 [Pseudomonadota bacterium]